MCDRPALGEALAGLPAPLPQRLREVASAAAGEAYLVGGPVRDLLLGRPLLDVDLVVVGDARQVARRLAAEIVKTTEFLTVTVRWPDGSLWDLATARSEQYPEPASLPRVLPSDLSTDLVRRDFTVNAMAVALDPMRWGGLVDPHRGLADLRAGVIRVLHPASFQDDPTRLFRAVRFAARLDLKIESQTARLFKAAVGEGLVDRLSGDRVRHELVRSLSEPEALAQAETLSRRGLLAAVSPLLAFRRDRAESLEMLLAETAGQTAAVAWLVRLLGLVASSAEAEGAALLASRLRLERQQREALHAFVGELQRGWWAASPAGVVARLEELPDETVLALGARWPRAREAVVAYLREWRHVRPELTGHELLAAGLRPGPAVGEVLRRLREAKLDGAATGVADEWRLVRQWTGQGEPR